jgi:RimJ/RimL family protein N-acetyltransferase
MTNHIQLRDVIESDLQIFFEQQLDSDATKMAAFPSRRENAFMTHWKTKVLVDDSVLVKTILFNGEVAGNIVCFEQLGEREVGYWLGKEYWGKGIATKALEDFLKHIKTRPLYAHVAKHNIGSRRVLEKCGFTVTGEERFFSQILGEDIEEYVLVLKPDHDHNQLTNTPADKETT